MRLRELSGSAVADALGSLLTDQRQTDLLRERGRQRAALFSWSACAEAHLRAYRTAAQ